MIAGSCDTARELIPELALGRLDGAERAEVLLHVHGCPRCQAILDDFNGVADLLSRSAPEAEPSAGFDRRVLVAMRSGRSADRRSLRRRVLAIGAVAAAAAILSVAVVRIVDAGRGGEQASSPALRTAPMVGGGGLTVGRVVVASGRPASVVVTVDYALPDGAYQVELLATPGATDGVVGTIAVANGQGSWAGTVPLPPTGPTILALLDAGGRRVCHARLEPV
jgi:hypothetical protein